MCIRDGSTRTQASFELAGKKLGADVMNMAMQSSSVKKGETLIDTALTLNAMHSDPGSYTHLRAHETGIKFVGRLQHVKKKQYHSQCHHTRTAFITHQ